MGKWGVVALLTFVLTSPAFADLPDEVLDKDYQNCLGGDQDPDRAAYCMCVREGMKNWDMDSYVAMSQQTTPNAAASGAAMPAQLEALAKKCVTQVLH